jgi:hypothetical protein
MEATKCTRKRQIECLRKDKECLQAWQKVGGTARLDLHMS